MSAVPKFSAWLDADGEHVWCSHLCASGTVVTMLPHPQWSVEDQTRGTVTPSVDCRACGAHEFLTIAPPPLMEALAVAIDRRRTPEFMARLQRNREKHKDLLDRLATPEGGTDGE